MEEKTLTDIALSHYTEAHLVLDDRKYEQARPSTYSKPRGFWVSCDGEDDWAEWCRSEDYNLNGLKVRTALRLKPEANVLHIKDLDEIKAFTLQYGARDRFSAALTMIDWQGIAEKYDGILITPYLWEARLGFGTDWYYTWDCSSGCIWSTSVLEII